MSDSDPRSYRVAVVSDSLLAATLPALRSAGYGVVQLPPASLDADTVQAWLEQVAEHVAEFARTGYDVVLIDDGALTARLDEALLAAGAGPLRPYVPGSVSRRELSTPSSRRRRAG